MNNLIQYLKDTRAELTHVSWPTQKQIITYTIVVIVLSSVVAAFLGFFDFVFSRGISMLIG